MGKEKNMKLSVRFLLKNKFKLVERKDVFENMKMPYFVRNGVILFFNEPAKKGSMDFLISHGSMRSGENYVSTFRWINDRNSLIDIYESITREDFIDNE